MTERPQTDSEGFVDREAGTFLPALQEINPLSHKPTTDHKALVIRLELPYVQYAGVEALLLKGIEALEQRATDLKILQETAERGDVELPAPMRPDDIRFAYNQAREEAREAKMLYDLVRRPPRQQLNG